MFLRKFIMLSKQSEQNAKGHAKLEVRGRRGKVSISVENLKTDIGENDIYKAYLISNKESEFKEVDIGAVEVSKGGRGRLDWEFDPDAIGSKNEDIRKFNVIVVRLDGLESGKTEIELAGYIHKDDNTIKEVVQKSSIKDIEEELEQTQETEQVEEHSEEIDEVDEAVETEDKEELETPEETSESEEDVPKYENMQERYEELIEEVDEILEKEKTQSVDPETQDHEVYESYKSDDGLCNILKFLNEVDPLKDKLEGHMWWEVEYDKDNIDKGFLPYYYYLSNIYYPCEYMTQYATCQSQTRKYNHYIFGIIEKDQQIKYYAYGIPGEFKKKDQPHGGKTGFVTWHKSNDQDDLGYWLIYIDALTGNIVKPI